MNLSQKNVTSIKNVPVPNEQIFTLPEKVLQFGTGVLLRGLNDYYIDKANKQGVFNGRVVVVKSTDSGGADAFADQDGLYTHLIRGIDAGKKIDEVIINASVSRVLSAKKEWKEILKCAADPAIQIVLSNTTEVGITLKEDDKIGAAPPSSFPGKLLAFLYHRYITFSGSQDAGLVIIPTELILDNGAKLKNIVNALAKLNGLDEMFINWLNSANDFCNSLVDRIVPGKLSKQEHEIAEAGLGYKDELMIMSECYSLWAIETSKARTKEILSFSKADENVVIVDNIDKYRELKLRLLNGSHTFSCGLACVSGFTTVKEAMADETFNDFITSLMMDEISPAIAGKLITLEEAKAFANKVLDRYRNPYIQHQWLSISVQYTSKLKMRTVPLLVSYYNQHGLPPQHMALGFAAYLLFMKSELNEKGQYIGKLNSREYLIQDDNAAVLHDKWKENNEGSIAHYVLQDENLWGIDLTQLPGLTNAVSYYLQSLIHKGVRTVAGAISQK
ncbi:tagaturonate reductase [Chitinophagaceae bacterium LWZ2-11]